MCEMINVWVYVCKSVIVSVFESGSVYVCADVSVCECVMVLLGWCAHHPPRPSREALASQGASVPGTELGREPCAWCVAFYSYP